MGRYRNSALYTVLSSIVPLQRTDKTFYDLELRPAQMFTLPSVEELQQRWPGVSEEQLEKLLADYREEAEKLRDLDLQTIYNTVKELVVSDMREQSR